MLSLFVEVKGKEKEVPQIEKTDGPPLVHVHTEDMCGHIEPAKKKTE